MILTLIAAFATVAALATVKGAAAEPGIAEKQAQARSVLTQIQEIDGQLGYAIEQWNGARYRLGQIEADLDANARQLKIARSSLAASQRHLAERLVALYVSGGDASALEVLLGAVSLDDLLSRMEAVSRVTDHDTRVLGQVKEFKAEIQKRKAQLQRARTAQKREVAELAARRGSIETQLRERERMLASIRNEIATLQAAEARRQARLAAEARRRVAALAQQRAAQEQAAADVVPPTAEALPDGGELPVEEAIPEAPAARYGGVVGIAMQYLGVPYKWGGASPSTGFDCSGFIMYVYGQIGVSLPHYTGALYQLGSPVAKSDLQPGDLVFFNGLGHAGIYVGGGSFIHSPHTGDVVKISSLSDSWYARTWVGGRRL